MAHRRGGSRSPRLHGGIVFLPRNGDGHQAGRRIGHDRHRETDTTCSVIAESESTRCTRYKPITSERTPHCYVDVHLRKAYRPQQSTAPAPPTPPAGAVFLPTSQPSPTISDACFILGAATRGLPQASHKWVSCWSDANGLKRCRSRSRASRRRALPTLSGTGHIWHNCFHLNRGWDNHAPPVRCSCQVFRDARREDTPA